MTETSTGRRLFPKSGAAYELFDCAILVALIAFISYIVTPPLPLTTEGLAALVTFADTKVWGSLLMAIAAFAAICSYFDRLLRVGLTVLITASLFWSLCFALGLVFFDAPLRTASSMLIYAWVASRLYRESGYTSRRAGAIR